MRIIYSIYVFNAINNERNNNFITLSRNYFRLNDTIRSDLYLDAK